MPDKRIAAVTAGVVVCVLASAARAVPITFQFTGQIDSIEDLGNVWGGQIHAGSLFSGNYTFDSEAPDRYPEQPQIGRYDLLAMTLVLDCQTISGPGSRGSIGVTNNVTAPDAYNVGIYCFESGPVYISELYFSLTDNTGGALADDDLPVVPPPLDAFSSKFFLLDGYDIQTLNRFVVRGTLTALVPEPTAGILSLCAATLWLGAGLLRRPVRNR